MWQPPEKKAKTSHDPSTDDFFSSLSDAILVCIFDYLNDLDLISISHACHRFFCLRTQVLLQNMAYKEDQAPIRGPGQAKKPITSVEHLSAAEAALLHAFRVRATAKEYPKTGDARIILYRVSEKKSLTETEKKRFTVQGPFWTLEKTAAWILGGVFSNTPFVLLTPPTEQCNFVEGDKRRRSGKTEPAIYAREILQILSAGYTLDIATDKEKPRKAPPDTLVLRPPQTADQKTTDILKARQTRLSPALWDRDQKDPQALVITLHGNPVRASDLATYFDEEVKKMRQVVKQVIIEASQ